MNPLIMHPDESLICSLHPSDDVPSIFDCGLRKIDTSTEILCLYLAV